MTIHVDGSQRVNDWEDWLGEQAAKQAGDVFVDCGANVGQWARTLAPRFRSVVAVEPNPQAWRQLEHDLPRNVAIVRQPLWSEPRSLTFRQYESSAHLSAFVIEDTEVYCGRLLGTLPLMTTTLDDLMRNGPIDGDVDFIKIDTEGAEIEILEGATELLGMRRPNLLIEVHRKGDGPPLRQLLRGRFGYRVEEIRHPLHAPGSYESLKHWWLYCEP